MSRALLLVVPLTLAACGHVPVSTLWALRSFDAVTMDPAQLRAAIRIPETLEPQPSGVTLKIGWWREGQESEKREATFVLRDVNDASDLTPLVNEKKPGTRLYAYRVDPADVPRIRRFQAQALSEKASGAKIHGVFGVGADACRRDDLPTGAVLMTTYLRVDPRAPYLTALKDLDLRTLVTKEKSFDALVPICAKQ